MTLKELTELASRYGLIRVEDKGPYWNNTVFLWEDINNDETDGWVIKYDNWYKSLRICTHWKFAMVDMAVLLGLSPGNLWKLN